MKTLPNEIVLRPRFEIDLIISKKNAIQFFKEANKSSLLVKCIDEHIFIKFKKENTHFWSPQLHLEIYEKEDKSTSIFGRFGPNPTLWTFFMFLHFGVAFVFCILSIWAYTNWSLEKKYGIQIGLLIFLVFLWFLFYSFGRIGKKKGKPQMKELHLFMRETLKL